MYKSISIVFVLFLLLSGCTAKIAEESQPVQIPPTPVEAGTLENDSTPGGEPVIEPTPPALDQTPAYGNESNKTIEVIATDINESLRMPPRVPCVRQFSPRFGSESYYYGRLFDAHFHLPNVADLSKIGGSAEAHASNPVTDPVLGRDVQLEKILCTFDKENTTGAIAFLIGGEGVLEETLVTADSIKTNSSGQLRLFLMPVTFKPETLSTIQENNPGLLHGLGEIAFYFEGTSPPDSSQMLKIYDVAEKHNLLIMAHPAYGQKSQIERIIQKYPRVKFLLHGPESEEYITDLMDKYPNVYYSVDAVLARIPPSPAALMYRVRNKQEFLSEFPKNFDLMLGESESSWKLKIEQYPERFMWGSDRGYAWTYDEDVSVLVEEFARAFIARLDPEVREKFAHGNAEKLLQNAS